MAEHLSSIFGTEKDRVNCFFYFKIDACRHGGQCFCLHTIPSIGPTLLLSNMYQRPEMITPGIDANGQPIDPCKIQEQFRGHSIVVEFSPATDFWETTCRQYEENNCNCGSYCNFMHLKRISKELRRQLFGRYWGRCSRSGSRSRSRSPIRHRSHEDRAYGYGGRGHGWRYDDGVNYDSRRRRYRSTSLDRQKGRSRSPARRRDCSPVSESNEERHASIEQWNRAREQRSNANRVYSKSLNKENMEDDKGYERVGDHCAYEGQ